MTDNLAIALAQLNPTVGDVARNVAQILTARAQAAAQGADLVVYSELVVSGYPPEDLVLKAAFQRAIAEGVAELARATADGGPAMLVSAPWRGVGAAAARLFNSALLLADGEIKTVRHKHNLPNYGVFDELRVFASGPLPGPMVLKGVRLGVMTCEDMWFPEVTECLEESGAEILIVPNGSPYESAKGDERLNYAVARVTESGLPLIYVNQVGGQDELVFDGASFVLNGDCSLAAQAPAWREDVSLTRWQRNAEAGWSCEKGAIARPPEEIESIYQAMVVGLRDYVRKNRFPGVLIGLSGGIDSAITTVVAVDALGSENVRCVMMPSPYTSRDSLEDAAGCAAALGVRLDTIAITPAMEAFAGMLKSAFGNRPPDTTEENIQARIRGVTLMAMSNKFGALLVTTGNKSEMSVGYATLYGDMCGGYSVLKDIYKTTVYELANWRNANRPEGASGPAGMVIPHHTIVRAPSAELKPDQTDQDSLPPYVTLDAILRGLIEEDLGVEDLVARGHDEATVVRVWRMLEIAEYKRRQAPPGVKITRRAFGRDRRYPITNVFKG
jgi:NAD+ synthase